MRMVENKKIAIFSHSSNLNGAERYLIELLLAIRLRESNVDIYFYAVEYGPLIDMISPYVDNISYVNIPWWIGREKLSFKEVILYLKKILKSSWFLSKVLKNNSIDIVITNTIAIPIGALSAFFANKKHIWCIHELCEEGLGYKYIFSRYVSLKLISFFSSRIVFNSIYTSNSYSFNNDKTKILYQPVLVSDVPFRKKGICKPLRLIIVGRVSEGKGQLQAVKASLNLLDKGYNLTLTIVGGNNSAYCDKIRELICGNKNIKLIEFCKDTTPYYLDADVALVCSKAEAFGRVTVEAMKYGLPVIASDRGGSLEIVKDGVNGYLYKYWDLEDLENKILRMFDRGIYEKMAHDAYQGANSIYSLEKFSREIYNVLNEI